MRSVTLWIKWNYLGGNINCDVVAKALGGDDGRDLKKESALRGGHQPTTRMHTKGVNIRRVFVLVLWDGHRFSFIRITYYYVNHLPSYVKLHIYNIVY